MPATPPTTPTDPVTLPVGYFDAEDGRHQELTIRRLTGRDRKMLGEAKYQQNPSKLVTNLIASTIVEFPGTPTDMAPQRLAGLLTCADRNHIILQLRANSMGNDLSTNVQCPHCKENNEVELDISTIPSRELTKIEFHGEGNARRLIQRVAIPELKLKAALLIPNGEDESSVIHLIKKNPIEGAMALMARCLLELNGAKPERDALDDMDWATNDKLSSRWSEELPGPEMSSTVECHSCGMKVPMVIMGADFFSVGSPQ
jgi:hypothetical protein